MRHSVMLLLILVLGGCSTLKTPQQPQAKLDADAQLRFALHTEAMHDYPGAKAGFEIALAGYRSFGELKGQLAALSGLARLELATDAPAQHLSVVKQMEDLTASCAPEMDYYLLLLRIHKLQLEKDFAAVSRLAVAKETVPIEEKIQLQIAKLQADSYLQTASPMQVLELKKLSQALQKQIRKRRSASQELLSSAWYATGYYYFQTKNYPAAAQYAEKVVDWDYRYGNFGGLAHGLWLQAQVAVAQNKTAAAISLYTRAEGIFGSLGETTLQNNILHEIAALKGN